ncbi:MAG: DUF790 family protein [Deltaproteobacteria bacterium]|nr:DUF790 family protein [Deltaproteobacteria bacterium]
MLPQSLLLCNYYPTAPQHCNGQIVKWEIVPQYFTERDYPWLSQLIEEYLRFKGQTRRRVVEHFRGKTGTIFEKKKCGLVFHLLHRMSEDDNGIKQGVKPSKLRAQLFEEAATSVLRPASSSVLSSIARQNKIESVTEVLEAAFSDLPLERRLVKMPESMTSQKMALLCNLSLIQGIVSRSSQVEIKAFGSVRRVIRQAKLRKLLCQVENQRSSDNLIIRVSGPLSLFGHTQIYGRSLAELIPLLPWCELFKLSAICRIRGRDGLLQIKTGVSIPPASEPKQFDSTTEAQFAINFNPYMADWELIREPEPICLKGTNTLVFPDFMIRHRRNQKLKFFVEIIGFWTPEYLSRKTEQVKKMEISNMILCVDEVLICEDSKASLELSNTVIFYKRKVKVADVMSKIIQLSSNRFE